jgi:hypothetical protein
MEKTSWLDQVGFVAKVIGVSVAIAIGFKTIAPRLPIPATATVSLAMVLTPAILLGGILTWQLWTANDANPTHPRRD